MNARTSNKSERKEKLVPEWIWEVLLVLTVSPALVYALNYVPPAVIA
jgi:hypothetical protein